MILYLKHFLFWNNLIWMLWFFQTFIWKVAVCSVLSLTPLQCEGVGRAQLTPENKSTTWYSLWFPDDFTSIRYCPQELVVPTLSSWSICVAPCRTAWPYCEQAGELGQLKDGGGVMIFDRGRLLPAQFAAWLEILTYHPFPEFLQLSSKHLSSLNC